jgi:predicted nucleic acid-binding protein
VKVVFDTNVLVSGILGRKRAESTPGELLRRLQDGDFELALSETILDELRRTLEEDDFLLRIPISERQELLGAILHRGFIVRISVLSKAWQHIPKTT